MDVNRTPFVLWDRGVDFAAPGRAVAWDEGRGGLVLVQTQQVRVTDIGAADGLAAWENARPLLMDGHGQFARPDGDRIRYWSGRQAEHLRDGALNEVTAPAGEYVDLDVDGRGRLVAAFTNGANAHGVTLFDLGTRQVRHARIGHAPRRIAVDRDGEGSVAWVVCRDHLVRVAGEPLPQPYHPDPGRFEPMITNPGAWNVDWEADLPAGGWESLAIACNAEHVFVLAVNGRAEQALLTRPNAASERLPWRVLPLAPNEAGEALPFAVDLHCLAGNCLALLSGWSRARPDCQAIAVDLSAAPGWRAVNERYPMHQVQDLRFVRSADRRARYQAAHRNPQDPDLIPPARPRLLLGLARPEYPRSTQLVFSGWLDGLARHAVWHRLFLSACLPRGCRLEVSALASDTKWDQVPGEGRGPVLTDLIRQPDPVAYGEADAEGFAEYETLLQTGRQTVTRLQGRYLRVGVRIVSDGRASPVIRRLRAYFPRFSYQEAYLPEHMRQHAAPEPGDPNGADVRERVLAAFEGMLTPLEQTVSDTERLLDPSVTDPPHLHWLAETLGYDLPEDWPAHRKRHLLNLLGKIQRHRGTLGGLLLELDVLSDGDVSRGALVPLENFRLRRTFATALGVDLEDDDHPLTLGTALSANSIVGDGLLLGADDARELLAMAAPDLVELADRERVRRFFERFSHQVTILMHTSSSISRAALEAVLARIVPAHTVWHIVETDKPFVLGLAPLLGFHTFIERELRFAGVRLGDSHLGREHVIVNARTLSPQDVHARHRSSGEA